MTAFTRSYLLNLKFEKEEADRKKREADAAAAKKEHIAHAVEEIKEAIIAHATAGATKIRLCDFSEHSPLALAQSRCKLMANYRQPAFPTSNRQYEIAFHDCSKVISESVVGDIVLELKKLFPDSLVCVVEGGMRDYPRKEVTIDWS